MIAIHTRTDAVNAFSEERAFVFLWVNWAVHATKSKKIVESVVDAWQQNHSDSPVPCYAADVSDQSGELWDALIELLERDGQPAGQLLMSGYGPLMLIHHGHVAMNVLPDSLGAEKLKTLCQSIWDECRNPSC